MRGAQFAVGRVFRAGDFELADAARVEDAGQRFAGNAGREDSVARVEHEELHEQHVESNRNSNRIESHETCVAIAEKSRFCRKSAAD